MKPRPLTFGTFVALLALTVTTQAGTYTWTPTAEGTYSWNNSPSNWTSGFPNAAADVANLNINLAGAQLINLNQAITLLTLNLGDTGSTYYSTTLAAGSSGSLTMAASGTIAKSTAANNVEDTISANVTLNGDLTVTNKATASSGVLTFSGTIAGATGVNPTLTKKGVGNLNLNGNTTLAGLAVSDTNTGSAGTVKVGSGRNLTVNGGAGKDLVVRSNVSATLDVSEATKFSADVGNFWIGGFGTGWNGTLKLGADNVITARTAFRVGDGNVGSTGATGTITTVAGGATTIHTPLMKVGYIKNNTGSFTLGSNHTLTLDGIDDGRTQLIVADPVGVDSKAQGTLDFSAGTAILKLSSVVIAKDYSVGTVTLSSNSANRFDVSGTGNVVVIGTNSRANASYSSVGSLTIGNLNDGTLYESKIETTTDGATAILLAQKSSVGASSGTLNLNGGTLTIATSGAAIAGGGGTSELYLGNTTGNGSGATLKVGAASSASSWITGLSAAKIKATGVTFNTNGYNITIDQALLTDASSTGGGLTKEGTGSLTLSSASNSYTGATNVNKGTLIISGAGSINSSSEINVAATGKFVYDSSTALNNVVTLSGNGSSNRAVFGGEGPIGISLALNNVGDVLSPGNSPGVQQFTVGQSWSSFSYDWEVNDFTGTAPGTAFDQITITGTLNLAGGLNSYVLNVLSLNGLNEPGEAGNFSETNRSWNILSASGGIENFDSRYWTINTTGFSNGDTGTWSLAKVDNNFLVLSYTAVPEPAAAMLGGLGLVFLLRRRRN